jgi:hypothetical protein
VIELWREVVDFEGLYEISNFGRVKSCARIVTQASGVLYPVREKIIALGVHTQGYKLACLAKDGARHTRLVHRLVAIAFIPNPNALPDVNHLDMDKTNNCTTNLEWCTPLRNQRHAAKNGRFHGRTNTKFQRKLTPESADIIRDSTNSYADLAAQYGVSEHTISDVRTKRSWLDPAQVYANES